MKRAVVVLAAGKGKRMKSNLPKILHSILGIPMIELVINAIEKLDPSKLVMVVGNGEEKVREVLESYDINFVRQIEQLGTGHAVICSKDELDNFKGNVLIINGDFPLITSRTLESFYRYHTKTKSALTLLSSEIEDPAGYGRVIRNENENVINVIEDKDCSNSQKNIKEINAGAYIVDSKYLWGLLDSLSNKNSQKEFYLPDIIKLALDQNLNVSCYKSRNSDELFGVNDRNQLSIAQSIMQKKINMGWMQKGVSLIDPGTVYISPLASIGKDSIIFPNTYIMGDTLIGRNCSIGPCAWIQDCKIGNNVNIKMNCYLERSRVLDGVQIGPFAHIRPDTFISSKSKIGNFVEIKNSKIGKKSKVPHLSYIGDASLGRNVNIGAGTITCNYDGFSKHRTIIEDGVFIGSDTMLVAPLKVGKNSTTGAGSTITKDVQKNSLAISRAKQTIIPNWQRKPK